MTNMPDTLYVREPFKAAGEKYIAGLEFDELYSTEYIRRDLFDRELKAYVKKHFPTPEVGG